MRPVIRTANASGKFQCRASMVGLGWGFVSG
jgi:hypothetical protein